MIRYIHGMDEARRQSEIENTMTKKTITRDKIST